MSAVIKLTEVPLAAATAYYKFIEQISVWWPKNYTWSKDKLVLIKIDNKVNGKCTEFGPYDFQCDWGRVLETVEGEKILFLWQIDPGRAPQPDPEKCSQVEIRFSDIDDSTSQLQLIHRNFENHGEKYHRYYELMNSSEGWDFIINAFIDYCTNR